MADEFHAGLCSTTSWWNTMRSTPSINFPLPSTISCSSTATIRDITSESLNWTTTQPFLPVELNQIQTGFGDSSMMNDQAMLPGLFEPIDLLKDMNDSWGSTNKFGCSSISPQLSRVSSPSQQQLTFSNNTPFWNPSAINNSSRFDDESSSSNRITIKPSESKKNGSDQPAAKKARIATPSPMPTFKVRKEKLGDRITALQQLVSPFGKTDTASVLHEAIEYIKFLHGQVGALSTPYLKNGNQMQHQMGFENSKDEEDQDLRSRGLCLVPISSTFTVSSDTPMDFWAPTFLGGGYRLKKRDARQRLNLFWKMF